MLCASGHSLGGALATLAAYDIRKALQACGKGDAEVMCYSIGAPRTGNHAFARDYNCVVPDTWSIINDQAGLGQTTCIAYSMHARVCINIPVLWDVTVMHMLHKSESAAPVQPIAIEAVSMHLISVCLLCTVNFS